MRASPMSERVVKPTALRMVIKYNHSAKIKGGTCQIQERGRAGRRGREGRGERLARARSSRVAEELGGGAPTAQPSHVADRRLTVQPALFGLGRVQVARHGRRSERASILNPVRTAPPPAQCRRNSPPLVARTCPPVFLLGGMGWCSAVIKLVDCQTLRRHDR